MNTRELEYFMMIVEKGNLTVAAQELYVSQPTLSKYIDRLEEEIGTPLFEKVNRSMKLTYAGERYLYYVREILSIKHDLDVEMAQILKEKIGVLKIGIPNFRASILLPKILPVFKEEYPNVQIELYNGSSQEIDNKIKEGKLDLAFYYFGDNEEEFKYEIISRDHLGVVVPDHHPVIQRVAHDKTQGVYLEWLKDEHILVQKRTTRHGQLITRLLEGRGFDHIHEGEQESVLSNLILAKNGYGIAFCSESFAQGSDYNFFPVLDYDQCLDFVVAYRKRMNLPQYARRFIDLVKENFNHD